MDEAELRDRLARIERKVSAIGLVLGLVVSSAFGGAAFVLIGGQHGRLAGAIGFAVTFGVFGWVLTRIGL
jgi:hypothetical protein